MYLNHVEDEEHNCVIAYPKEHESPEIGLENGPKYR
jgi:hypothetical protein